MKTKRGNGGLRAIAIMKTMEMMAWSDISKRQMSSRLEIAYLDQSSTAVVYMYGAYIRISLQI